MVLADDPDERVRAALELWAAFPIDADPRPLIINGSPVHFDAGFDTAEAKTAYLAGAIESHLDLPPDLIQTLRPRPGRPHDGPSLRVVAATRMIEEFMTDRGPRRLPAWRLDLSGARGPFIVLDPQIERWWPSGWDPRVSAGELLPPSRLAPDHRTLTYRFAGAPPSEAHDPTVDVHESATAVLVRPVPVPAGRRRFSLLTCDRDVTVQLARPLGNRVLINEMGRPATVVG